MKSNPEDASPTPPEQPSPAGRTWLHYGFAVVLALLAMALGTVGLFGPRGPRGRVTRTTATYQVPDVALVNQDGARVRLRELLSGDTPVFLNFLYTTCTTTSPLLSATFSAFQRTLAPDSRAARLVSITIDPENDAPRALKDHLNRYRALPGWDFLTGRREDIEAVLRSFDVPLTDKEQHEPLTLARLAEGGPWVRLQGVPVKADLVREWRQEGRKPP